MVVGYQNTDFVHANARPINSNTERTEITRSLENRQARGRSHPVLIQVTIWASKNHILTFLRRDVKQMLSNLKISYMYLLTVELRAPYLRGPMVARAHPHRKCFEPQGRIGRCYTGGSNLAGSKPQITAAVQDL
jgi:hypothetical protein